MIQPSPSGCTIAKNKNHKEGETVDLKGKSLAGAGSEQASLKARGAIGKTLRHELGKGRVGKAAQLVQRPCEDLTAG